MAEIERRKNTRIKYKLDVETRGVEKGYLESFDISPFGIFIKTDEPLNIDTKVFISFKLPDSPMPIKTYGRVAWNNLSENGPDNQPPGTGIEFLSITEFNSKRLEKFLENSVSLEVTIESENHTLFDFSSFSKESFKKRSEYLFSYIDDMKKKGYYTYRRPLVSSCSNRVEIFDDKTGKHKEMIMLASNNYLGLADHPEVVASAQSAIKKYGVGTASAPMLSGTFELHKELESKIADFIGTEDAIIFPSGYSASIGAISGLIRNSDQVFIDRLAHASLLDGCLLSGVKFRTFRHSDVISLRNLLERSKTNEEKLVVVEGVYSMDGDVTPLPDIMEVAKDYNAKVLLDEAHSIGVLGHLGKGTASHFNLETKPDITLGTFSKSLGQMGGFVASSKFVVNYLRHYGRSYFFSASPPPVIIASVLKALEIMQNRPELQQKLWENINYFKNGLNKLGFDTGHSQSAVIPIYIGEEATLKKISVRLHEEGVYVNPIPYPATQRNKTVFRASIMATHTKDDLDISLKAFEKVGEEFGVIGKSANIKLN